MADQLSQTGGRPGTELLALSRDDRHDYASLVSWGMQSGLITVMEACELTRQAELDPYTAADEVDRIDELVETSRIVLAERDTAAADRLAKAFHKAMEHATLVPQGQRWVRRDNALDLETIRRRATRSIVADLMTDHEPCPAH